MKKIFLVAFVLTTIFANSQSLSYNDVGVLLAKDNLYGTARLNAMGGAFGALGGDLSATANPASGAVFLNSEASATLYYRNADITSSFYGTTVNNNDDFFNLSQAGAVLIFETNQKNNWGKIALGLNYSLTNDFKNNWISKGNSGIADSSWTADPLNDTDSDPTNDIFYTTVDEQAFGNYTKGNNSKFTISLASQYNDNLYLGFAINTGSFDFNQQTVTEEYLSDNTSPNPNLLDVSFIQDLTMKGESFSFGIGMISKIAANLRLGLAYQSPSWYTIAEEFVEEDSELTYSNVNVTDVYNSGVGAFDYKLRTPSSLTGSLAYVFAKKGTLSVDYIYKDYSKTNLSGDTDFTVENNNFSTNLVPTSSFRIGGELREKDFSFRAGYHYDQSPIKNALSNENLNGYSFGLGYKFGNTKVDLSYENNTQNSQYGYHAEPTVNPIDLKTATSNISATVVISL